MHSAALGGIFITINYVSWLVLFKSSLCLLIFCLSCLSVTDRGVLKSFIVIVDFLVPHFSLFLLYIF